MPTATDYARLRRDVGANEVELSDAQAAEIFAEAAESYVSDRAIHAAARVILLQGMLAQAAHEVNYTQNNASESLSDRFRNLSDLLKQWQARLNTVLAEEAVAEANIPASHSVVLRRRW